MELRDFLTKAGCAVRTDQALGEITARLPRDRAFHRDLTSYVWVVIDRCEGISYPDLLGVLAVAAAGSTFAAAADEGVAHSLLRFLMEARHSLDALSVTEDRAAARGTAEVTPNPAAETSHAAPGDGQAVSIEPVQLAGRDLFSPEEQDNGRKGRGWVIAGGCFLVALLIGLWLKYRPAESNGNRPAPVTSALSGNVAATPLAKESIPPPAALDAGVTRAAVASPMPRTSSRVISSARAARSSRRVPAAPVFIPSPAPVVRPPAMANVTRTPVPAETASTAAPPARAPDTLTASLPANHAAVPTSPAPVRPPTATYVGPGGAPSLSKKSVQLGQPDLAQQGSDDASRNIPVLHRRRPPAPASEFSEDGTNLASVEPQPAVPGAPGSSGNGSAGTAHGGTVHVTSLGIMAAYVLYSPVPKYPEAAYASHVQGEVKLSADVDRDGNVGSVRVISGPPQLQDAALDAVQRWRYRPFLAGGKPRPMSAIAVMDFELP